MSEFSRELCGGTHLDNTPQWVSSSSSARSQSQPGRGALPHLVGEAALEYVHEEEGILGELAAFFRVPPGQAGSTPTQPAGRGQDAQKPPRSENGWRGRSVGGR